MNRHGYIGRKLRAPKLKEKPAIIPVAFGTSSNAKIPLEIFRQHLDKQFPGYEVFWAYSSSILCRTQKIPTLIETLAQVEAAGFRTAVVQPLHIFPGTEYQQMAETCEYFPGLRIILSETLLHRWNFVKETLAVIENEFLTPAQGLNILAVHGTPLVTDPVHSAYLGLEHLVRDRYPNVLTAAIEGIPDHEAVLAGIKRLQLNNQYKVVRIIPMMYLAGMHAEEDLMGDANSWRTSLEEMNFSVECVSVQYGQECCFKGLAYYPEIVTFFTQRLQRSLELLEIY